MDMKVKFFLSTDDATVFEDAVSTYGWRIIHINRDCDDRSAECVKYALADLIWFGRHYRFEISTYTCTRSLSRTKLLLGSPWSSFTEAAQRMSPTVLKTMLVGKDFGPKA